MPPYESSQVLKSKLLYSINHCRAIDADYDRAAAPNEEEAVNDAQARDEAAAAAEDSGSPGYRRRNPSAFLGNQDNDSYGSNDGMGGMEEEEE